MISTEEEVAHVRRVAEVLVEQARSLQGKMVTCGMPTHAKELQELVEEMTTGLKASKEKENHDAIGVLRIEEFEAPLSCVNCTACVYNT